MDAKDSVFIVGGGLIGLLIAYELSESGERVVMLERGRVGSQASWAGGGILSPLYPWRYPDPVNRLAQWSQRHYRGLVERLREESGIDAEWRETGMVVLGMDSPEQVQAREWSAAWGGGWTRADATTVRELEPGLATRWQADALFDPSIAQVRNPRLVKALRAALTRRGVLIRENSGVEGFVVQEGRLVGLRVAGETLRAARCVVAGGAWSGQLLSPLGINLPIRPVRGQMLLIKAEVGHVRHMVMHNGRYLIPRSDGRILVGSTLEEVGFNAETTPSAREDLLQAALALIPSLARYPVEVQWAGLRPGSPDGIPFIGPLGRVSGLYVCTGHYRNGIVLGPASARLAADLILGRRPVLDPAPYALVASGRTG